MYQALSAAIIFLGLALMAAAAILISVRLFQARPDFVVKILKYALVGAFVIGFSGASIVIGLRIDDRHTSTYSRGLKAVQQIWGGSIRQKPPTLKYPVQTRYEYTNKKTGTVQTRNKTEWRNMGMESQNLDLNLKSSIRKKGLLKFAGYRLSFQGDYTIRNYRKTTANFRFDFPLPDGAGNITNLKVELDGKPYTGDTNLADGIDWAGRLRPGETRRIRVSYEANGTDRFLYALSGNRREVRNLNVNLTTDFAEYSIPNRAMVPTSRAGDDSGAKLGWKSSNLITGQNIAIRFEVEGNYGKVASRLFFYSPLALILFTGLLLVVTTARGMQLHPMHYLFLMTGFFIFYLFGSYVISFMHIIPGIALSLVLSTGIMLYYAFLIKKGALLIQSTAFAAAMFQWIFSIAFFFPAYTGFLITIAAIIAFVVLMRATAAMDWENKW